MTETKRPLNVFLCHSSSDKPIVRELYKQLQADGVNAWLDVENLLPGQAWQAEIPDAVRNSDIVIVCISEESVNKDGYVKQEIEFALDIADKQEEGTIFIIPARLQACTVPERLAGYQWVDLFEPEGYAKLLRSLRKRARVIEAVLPGKRGLSIITGRFSKPIVFGTKLPQSEEKPSEQNKTNGIGTESSNSRKRGRQIAEAIGLIASIIGLIAFLTGWENIGQMFGWTMASMPGNSTTTVEHATVISSSTVDVAFTLPPVQTRTLTITPSKTPVMHTETVTFTPEPGYTIVEPLEVLNIAPGLRALGQLAVEKYSIEERNQINNTLTFTINSTPDVPILWRWFWCAANDRILEQNMTKISIVFDADGYLIPVEQLATVVFENSDPIYEGWKCVTYETVLRDWKPGTYKFTQTMTISSPINDGGETFEAGYKIYEYTVNISP